jgi:hypothetical protein
MFCGGLSQPPKHRWGGQLEGVNTPIHIKGFTILKKILEKKFGGVAFFVLPLAGWVGMSIEHILFHNIA